MAIVKVFFPAAASLNVLACAIYRGLNGPASRRSSSRPGAIPPKSFRVLVPRKQRLMPVVSHDSLCGMRVDRHTCRERQSSGRTAVQKGGNIGARGTTAVACLMLLGLPGPAHAADAVSCVGQVTATPTFESVGLIVPFGGDDNRDIRCRVQYRRGGTSDWERGLSCGRIIVPSVATPVSVGGVWCVCARGPTTKLW